MKIRVDILAAPDVQRVRDRLKTADMRIIWDIGCTTGLRISDILEIQAYQLIKPDAYIREKKTKKLHRIYVHKHIRDYMQAKIDKGEIKPYQKAFAISRSQAWRNIKTAAAAANIKTNVGTHSMRKSYAKKYMYRHGLKELKARLNHSHIGDTIGYITSNADLGLDERGYPKKRRKK